jgi:hypothetical protein
LDPVGTNNNGDLCVEDQWDWANTDDDDYVVIDDYAVVDLVMNQSLNIEDAYDWFPADPDDETYQFLDTDSVGPTLVIPFSMPPEDPWDHTQAEDDWAIPDDYALISVLPTMQVPVADAWDHFSTDDDDYAVTDDYQSVNNTPTVVADGWDHWLTDPDDELFLGLDYAVVLPSQDAASVDPVDHWTQDADDEEWIFRNSDAVEPKRGLPIEDAWDHFTTSDDEWTLPEDYAIVNYIPPPSQFTDDNFDWFYEPAEDNEQDYAVTEGQVVLSVYLLNPYFEVFIPLRPFTVTWGALDADV